MGEALRLVDDMDDVHPVEPDQSIREKTAVALAGVALGAQDGRPPLPGPTEQPCDGRPRLRPVQVLDVGTERGLANGAVHLVARL